MQLSIETPSRRQLTVLSMCANGMTREEIGCELFLSPETVKKDLDRARETLGAVNVTHAVAISITVGYLIVADEEIAVADVAEFAAAA